jgi:predicted Zn-ribbon and HTH transcriptional regulator
MSIDNRDQRVDQLLQGIYRLCVNTDDCSSCPFYVTKCTFGEPRPRTWFDEETIEIKAEADPIPVEETETETPLIEAIENAIEAPEEPEEYDDSDGTWLVSTTMGSVFSKYVYICSKCGYKKESVLSLTPMTKCPECEKRKAMRANN